MKCPQCGSEMVLDSHRKIPLNMCYACGYIEGRPVEAEKAGVTNFQHMKTLNFNETVAFVAAGLGIDEAELARWLDTPVD